MVSDLKVVRFKVQYTLYNAGETAGFEPEVAEDLIERKIADPVEPQGKTKKAAE